MNALLKNCQIERLPLSQLIPGWVQVALFGWMICWGNHPLPRIHATKVEYVAVNQTPWGWSEIEFANGKARQGEMNGSERIKTARIDCSQSSPEQREGRAERERASQTDFATAGYYFVYGSDGRLYGRYTPVKNQNLSRDYVGRVNGSSQSMSGTSLLNETIAWNPDGTQSGNSITRNGSVSASDPRTYGYNQRGELLLQNFSPSSGQNGSATYQFDGGAAGGLGLRTGVTLGVAMSGVTAQSYGTFGRLGSMSVSGSLTNNSVGTPVSQTYDAAGNVTTRTAGGSTDTLTWDAFGQLVKDVRTGTGAFTWSAIYDGLGRRLQTTQGALTVQSSYDPEVEFLELVTTINGVRNWHVTGPDLDGRYGGLNGCGGVEAVYNQSTSSATYLLSDTYGHTEGTLSGTTFVWNPTQCDGYGALPGTTKPSALVAGANVASQLGWRSHYIDPTGFYYMGARNYAPDSGTFLSPDPLGHSASMDLYSYCDGDPVNQYDADGRVGKAAVNYDGFRNVADLYSVSNVSWQSGNYLSAVGGYTAATAVGGGLVVDTVLNATGVGEVINLGLDALKVGFKKGGEFLASQLEKNVVTDAGKTGAGVADDAFAHGLKYDPRVRARGVQDPSSHNFPYSFDDGILAAKPIPQKNGYNIFQQPGSIAGKVITDPKTGIRTQTYKDGVFEIGVTKDGVIDHRFFRPN